MIIIYVTIKSKDLPCDRFYVRGEILGKAGGLSDPVVARELRERGLQRRGAGRDGGAAVLEAPAGVGGGGAGQGIGGEGARVGELAADPSPDQRDVMVCGHFDGLLVRVQPGVGVTPKPGLVQTIPIEAVRAPGRLEMPYRPADMTGQVLWLQMAAPVFASISWIQATMLSMFLYCSTPAMPKMN